jgi:hypothetical protein
MIAYRSGIFWLLGDYLVTTAGSFTQLQCFTQLQDLATGAALSSVLCLVSSAMCKPAAGTADWRVWRGQWPPLVLTNSHRHPKQRWEKGGGCGHNRVHPPLVQWVHRLMTVLANTTNTFDCIAASFGYETLQTFTPHCTLHCVEVTKQRVAAALAD